MREDSEAQDAADAAAMTARKKYEKENDLLQEQINALREINDLQEKGWKDDDNKVIEAKKKILEIEAKRIQQEITAAALVQDQLEVDKSQIALEGNRAKMIALNNQQKEKKESAEQANRAFRKEQKAKEAVYLPAISEAVSQKDIEEETYSTFPSDRDFENVVYTFSKRSHGN